MILLGILVYMMLNIGLAIYSARRVHNVQDFLLAGRSLRFGLATATVFATWFGAESVMGSSGRMAAEGLIGVVAEPFGAALCLILVGWLFAVPIYRMNLLTIGSFYRVKYGPMVEWVSSLLLIFSFLGWTAAQFVALGVLGNVLLGIDAQTGTVAGFCVVVLTTVLGGMWSVAILDFVHNAVVVSGFVVVVALTFWTVDLSDMAARLPDGYFRFIPTSHTPLHWLNYLAAWLSIGLGSIPGQDIYQRVMAARNEHVARWSALAGGFLYITIGLMPISLAVYLRAYHPGLISQDADLQTLVPAFIFSNTPPVVALLFLGALVSAVLSVGSGALMAPSAILTENILPHILPAHVAQAQKLRLARVSVIIMALLSLGMAVGSQDIHELALGSSALSLVSLFAIYVSGIFFKRAPSPRAALASMVAGTAVWAWAEAAETELEPMLWGLAASWLGLFALYCLDNRRIKSQTCA